MSTVVLQDIEKSYGPHPVVRSLSLHIGDGEFVSLLGPSGCGKTTTLRMIAGLEDPDTGILRIGERVVTDPLRRIRIPPEQRQIGMVFQSYAVWPHLTVRENIGYPLRLRRTPRPDQEQAIERVTALVHLEGLAERYPHQLSGGQQQRVALARALVMEPQVLLLDEPLSNLDAKLRAEMRFEIKALQRRLNITVVYVTHDQEEALVLSDRVAVMEAGLIKQVGTPRAIYASPADPFVADFVGSTNLLPGRLVEGGGEGGRAKVRLHAATGPLDCQLQPGAEGDVLVSIRPESVRLTEPGGPVEGEIEHVLYLGERLEMRIRLGEVRLRVYADLNCPWGTGDRVGLAFREAIAFRSG